VSARKPACAEGVFDRYRYHPIARKLSDYLLEIPLQNGCLGEPT